MTFTYKHPHPSVTVDCVVFGYDTTDLKVLLIRRKLDPFKGRWALPGGFVQIEEGLEEAARRELGSETGVRNLFLEQLYTFGDPRRDPREFIGPKSHGSARYTLRLGERSERHSSSGVIVSTGLGSTGWLTSLITGASAVASAFKNLQAGKKKEVSIPTPQFAWDAEQLFFTVREPFPSKTTGVSMVFGRVTPGQPLHIESHMAERGVIFSDGIEADFLEFNAGARALIGLAERKGLLVE